MVPSNSNGATTGTLQEFLTPHAFCPQIQSQLGQGDKCELACIAQIGNGLPQGYFNSSEKHFPAFPTCRVTCFPSAWGGSCILRTSPGGVLGVHSLDGCNLPHA